MTTKIILLIFEREWKLRSHSHRKCQIIYQMPSEVFEMENVTDFSIANLTTTNAWYRICSERLNAIIKRMKRITEQLTIRVNVHLQIIIANSHLKDLFDQFKRILRTKRDSSGSFEQFWAHLVVLSFLRIQSLSSLHSKLAKFVGIYWSFFWNVWSFQPLVIID